MDRGGVGGEGEGAVTAALQTGSPRRRGFEMPRHDAVGFRAERGPTPWRRAASGHAADSSGVRHYKCHLTSHAV